MNLYDAKVRLLGSLNNEVYKHDLTASEIAILQRMHGRDAVVGVKQVGEVRKRTDRSERNRLAGIYQSGPSADNKTRLSGESFIDSVLGVGNALPKEYVEQVEEAVETTEAAAEEEEVVRTAPEAEEPTEPIVRTKVKKPKTEAVVADAAENLAA